MSGLTNGTEGLWSGAQGLQVAQNPAPGLYNEWEGLGGGGESGEEGSPIGLLLALTKAN